MLISEKLRKKFLDAVKEGDISSVPPEKIDEILEMIAEIRTGSSSSGLFDIIARDGVNGHELRKVLEETDLKNSLDFSDVYESSCIAHSITVRPRKVVVQQTRESAEQATTTPRAASSSSDSQSPSCSYLGATTSSKPESKSKSESPYTGTSCKDGIYVTEKGVEGETNNASLVGVRIRGKPSKKNSRNDGRICTLSCK